MDFYRGDPQRLRLEQERSTSDQESGFRHCLCNAHEFGEALAAI